MRVCDRCGTSVDVQYVDCVTITVQKGDLTALVSEEHDCCDECAHFVANQIDDALSLAMVKPKQ